MKKVIDIRMFHECRGEHAHPYIQIMVPLEKTLRLNIADRVYDVTPQELCLVPRKMPHECDFSGRMLVLNLTEAPDDKDKVLLGEPIIVSMRGQIMQLVELIQAELKHSPNSSSVHYLYNFLYSKLLENHEPPH